jgi:hypothetical protein
MALLEGGAARGRPGAPAGVGDRRRQLWSGCLVHSRENNRVLDAEQLRDGRLDRVVRHRLDRVRAPRVRAQLVGCGRSCRPWGVMTGQLQGACLSLDQTPGAVCLGAVHNIPSSLRRHRCTPRSPLQQSASSHSPPLQLYPGWTRLPLIKPCSHGAGGRLLGAHVRVVLLEVLRLEGDLRLLLHVAPRLLRVRVRVRGSG